MRPASRSSLTAAATSSAASGLPWVARATRVTRLLESGRSAEPATRVAIAVSPQAAERQPLEARQAKARRDLVAEGDEERDPADPAGRESQRLQRGAVDPLRVVDAGEHRRLGGGRPEQAEHGGGDGEALDRLVGHRQRAAQRARLRRGQLADQPEHRMQQLVDPRERELGLVLCSVRAQEAHVARARRDGVEQRGLPHPRLACQHENPTVPCTGPGQHRVDAVELGFATDQHGPSLLARRLQCGKDFTP